MMPQQQPPCRLCTTGGGGEGGHLQRRSLRSSTTASSEISYNQPSYHFNPCKSLWSTGLYCSVEEDLDLKRWPYFNVCKNIWENVGVERAIGQGESDEGPSGGGGGGRSSEVNRSASGKVSSKRHGGYNLNKTMKGVGPRANSCPFPYEDPLLEEFSLSLEPVSSSSSHFSSDCDGDNNEIGQNGGVSGDATAAASNTATLASFMNKSGRISSNGDGKNMVLYPRMSTPANNMMMQRRKLPTGCPFSYEEPYLEDLSLEPISSSSSHFSDVDLEMTDGSHWHSKVSVPGLSGLANNISNFVPTTPLSKYGFHSDVPPMQPDAPPPVVYVHTPRLASPPPPEEKVTESITPPLIIEPVSMPDIPPPTPSPPAAAIVYTTPRSAEIKEQDNEKLPKLMEIKVDLEEKKKGITPPSHGEGKVTRPVLKISSSSVATSTQTCKIFGRRVAPILAQTPRWANEI